MKLNVSKGEIQEKLSNIQNVVEKRNTMLILSHFLLDVGRKGSYMFATDLETALKEPLDVEVEREGKLCIPARKLLEIAREVEGDLSFESTDERWLKVKAGASDFRLACLPAAEFPAWPALGGEDVEELTINASTLLEMIEKTIYSAGGRDIGYTLNGLLFHVRPGNKLLTVVGTDGYRLALVVKGVDGEVKNERRMIVPLKAVSELRRLLVGPTGDRKASASGRKVDISIGKNHMFFGVDKVQFLTRLIEGTYPDYETVIPRANEKKMFIERGLFTKALRRVSIMSRERANAVRFDIGGDNLIIVSASDPDLGEAKEEVAIDYKGDLLSIGFNARYLLDALGVMVSGKVILELQEPLSPALLKEERDEDYRCVIMPMRI